MGQWNSRLLAKAYMLLTRLSLGQQAALTKWEGGHTLTIIFVVVGLIAGEGGKFSPTPLLAKVGYVK